MWKIAYFGSMIRNNARCTREINTRIDLKKAAFNKQKALFTCNLELHLKKKLIQCDIWNIALCGAVIWSIALCGAVIWNIALCGAVIWNIALCGAVIWSIALCGAVIWSIALCGAVIWSTAL